MFGVEQSGRKRANLAVGSVNHGHGEGEEKVREVTKVEEAKL
jgi:hypothetical protein